MKTRSSGELNLNGYYKVLKGLYNEAKIFNKDVDFESEDLIMNLLNSPLGKFIKIRIMPDVHVGKEAVVGFTSSVSDVIVPGIIGVDIGCGVTAWNIGKRNLKFDKLDKFIRKNIPLGKEKHRIIPSNIKASYDVLKDKDDYSVFRKNIRDICNKCHISESSSLKGLGTLGGGNHFIEIDKDENKNLWLMIHSGSRFFGYCVAELYKHLAVTTSIGKPYYLKGAEAVDYLADIQTVQMYARLNRQFMADLIIRKFCKFDSSEMEKVESIHNYYSHRDNILRKGAISAHKDEKLIIPFSMSEGAIIAMGKGNADWNYSAPHGAGRKMSRSKAFDSLSLEFYKKQMQHIWSSSVNERTLDESPQAYKKSEIILNLIVPTVKIVKRLKPVYNLKAED